MQSLVACLMGLLVFGQAGATQQPTVSGHVRLSGGLPVAGAQVMLFDLADLRRGPVAQATTNENGQFALPLVARGGALALPQNFALGANYPNPFNPATVIPYELAATSLVRLEVFNALGQRLATLVDGEQGAGAYQAQWNGTDAAGRAAAAGVYIYRLTVDGAQQTRRMVLVDGQAGVPMGGASVAAEAPGTAWRDGVYGLVISGEGLVPYVNADFGVAAGMGPVDIAVEARRNVRMKVVQDEESKILGDVDLNSRVDIADALLVAMYSSNWLTLLNNGNISLADVFFGDISLGDVDCDGQISMIDAWLIAVFSVNPFDPALPEGIGRVGQCASAISIGGNEKAFSLDRDGSLKIEMVRIEPGVDPVSGDVVSTGFYLGKYEVTEGQYDAVMGTTSGRDPFLPVRRFNAYAFIDSLNSAAGAELYRLPTATEWKYACRAGTTTAWSFGDDSSELTYYAWYGSNTGQVQGVGLKLPNPWGLYDMHGNAAEMTGSSYGRGGDYDSSASSTNCGDRSSSPDFWGFRIVRVR